MAERYLLDTHYYLWWLNDDPKLKASTVALISAPRNEVFVSAASLWEISIKAKSGRLSLKTSLATILRVTDFEILDITADHILRLNRLPLHHQDPFDRILIAQALVEKCALITTDVNIRKYTVSVIN